MAKKKPRPPRQPRLHPTLEPERIGELDEASEEYVTCRDARMAYQKTEAEKKALLTELMHKHKQTRYEDRDERVVILSASEDLKVEKKRRSELPV